MSRKTIAVTGANGQLGLCIRDLAEKEPNFKFIFTDLVQSQNTHKLDVTKPGELSAFFAHYSPHYVINAAAYTNVEKAESNPLQAELINSKAVGMIAGECLKIGATLIQISTDYVFSGKSNQIIKENHATDPLSVYGKTKAQGEFEALKNPKTVVIRTSWLYSTYGDNFVKSMLKLAQENQTLNVVSDQWGTPTSAEDLARAILTVITKIETDSDIIKDKPADLFGIYHFSNMGATSWADYASYIFEIAKINCTVNFVSTQEYPTKAVRPKMSVLDSSKFSKTFNFDIPEWEQSLEVVLAKLCGEIKKEHYNEIL